MRDRSSLLDDDERAAIESQIAPNEAEMYARAVKRADEKLRRFGAEADADYDDRQRAISGTYTRARHDPELLAAAERFVNTVELSCHKPGHAPGCDCWRLFT